jgi:hypothetical protein
MSLGEIMLLTIDDINNASMTVKEVEEYLNIGRRRVAALRAQGFIKPLKVGGYYRPSVVAYKKKRGDKKAGKYPKELTEPKKNDNIIT